MINLPSRYSNILATFSAGGMADTLLCEDSNLKRKVILKSLKAGIEPHRLLDELAALSAIRSRYVVQVLDVIIDKGKPVGFVEEYLPGNELIPCPSNSTIIDALRALYPIAAGISEIHQHQRVHRDIKPDNMRYDSEGQLKIFDFGLAKLDTSPGTKVLYYSDGYAAPESFKQDHNGLHTFDYPIDVYAFGCVAVWLLNNGALLPEMMGTTTPSLPTGFNFATLPVQVDPSTAALLLGCLAPIPTDRPTMLDCRDHIAAELLRDRHKMTLTWESKMAVLDASRRGGTISARGCTIGVAYSGIAFSVTAVTGNVAINNAPAFPGQILTGSTVIVLRDANGKPLSVTCDVSHPEVML